MRFPFRFIGLLTLGIGLWAVIYLAFRPGLDSGSRALMAGTAVVCFGFGLYVLIRTARSGRQH